MKQKGIKVGVLFPDGDIKWLLFGTRTKDGFVYGISHADTHITALPEAHSVSFHLTNQSMRTRQHLGRIIKDRDYEDVHLKALNPKIVTDDGLDEQVVFVTKRGMELLNQPSDIVIIESETDDERILILDLLKFFNNSIKMLLELSKELLNVFGLCAAKEILSNKEYEAGLTSRETAIIDVDGDLYEVNIKAYLDLGNQENPLQEVFRPLGLPGLMPEINRRFMQVLDEKRDSLEKYSFYDS
jgi:hypothetical protein